jgi:hypothetical protein
MPYLIAELHEVVLLKLKFIQLVEKSSFMGSQWSISKYFAALAQFWQGHTSSYAMPGSSVTEMFIIDYHP